MIRVSDVLPHHLLFVLVFRFGIVNIEKEKPIDMRRTDGASECNGARPIAE
jgi:hypothetical protein